MPKEEQKVIYKDLTIVSDISYDVLSNLELDKLLNISIDRIVKKLNFLGGVLLLVDDNHLYAKTISGSGVNKFIKLIGKPISHLKIALEERESNVILQSVKDQKVHFSYDLYDFTRGVLSESVTGIAAAVTQTKACIVVPIIFKGKSLGALFFSKSQAKNFDEELPVLTFTSQILGIAITNAKYYTDLQNASLELVQKNEELASILQALSELRRQERDMMDVLAHELKTPITSILLIFELIQKNLNSESISVEQLKKYLKIGLESTKKEVSLLDILLSATKVESNKLLLNTEEFNLLESIQTLVNSYTETINKNIEIRFKKIGRNFRISADRIRVMEIVENLISNAVKYTYKGYIEIVLRENSKQIIFSIKDTGVGITTEGLKNLGKKFFRDKGIDPEGFERPGGTGLGLYVVYRLVDALGGTITAASAEGKGTTFTVTLNKVPSGKHV